MVTPLNDFHAPPTPAADGPINILLVDDQPAKLLGYQTILEELGENLLMAHSARDALEILLQNDVALLLVDVVMPELDGFELVEIIRAHPRFEKTAVMFVSGVHLSDIDRIRGYSAGAVDYVMVPIVPELLRAKVRVFADLHRKTRQLEQLNRELEARIAMRTADLEASTQRWKESEGRLRLALTAARAGAWEWQFAADPHNLVASGDGEMRWSPELFKLLGLSANGPAPTRAEFLAHVDADDRERVGALFQSLPMSTAEGPSLGSFELEFRFRRPGQRTPMWLRTTGEVVADADGRPIIARGIHQDVTSRKCAELQLEVEGRRKDEFLATLAHELRNPLAPILSCVRMLKSEALPPASQARSRDILERQVVHLVRLVDDLIDVSRISRGTITLHPQSTDLAALVRATVDATVLRASGHMINTEIPDRGPFVSVDPVRMAQVVSNILDNATKYTPAGGKIVVSLQHDDDDAVLRIVDTGIGIAPQNLERVFDLFAQVERGSGGRGLGIGLALVRRLLELQGGTVTANSPGEGLGTEIVVRLPYLSKPAAEDAAVQMTTPAPQEQPIRFLLVDDNQDAANTLAELLEMSGCEARVAYGGEEATRVGEGFEPDIVLLDLGMPIMDGFEAAKRVRQTSWGTRAKLVAVTGWGQASDRKKTADAGFDGHLVKPVDLDVVLELTKMVERGAGQ
jgi:signal transduction histidine kinase/DNA-binding response OmpR family regulator